VFNLPDHEPSRYTAALRWKEKELANLLKQRLYYVRRPDGTTLQNDLSFDWSL
jgi:hypothetical protein